MLSGSYRLKSLSLAFLWSSPFPHPLGFRLYNGYHCSWIYSQMWSQHFPFSFLKESVRKYSLINFISSVGQNYCLLSKRLAFGSLFPYLDKSKWWVSCPLHCTGLVTHGEKRKRIESYFKGKQYTSFSLFIKRVFTYLEATYQSDAFLQEPVCH